MQLRVKRVMKTREQNKEEARVGKKMKNEVRSDLGRKRGNQSLWERLMNVALISCISEFKM